MFAWVGGVSIGVYLDGRYTYPPLQTLTPISSLSPRLPECSRLLSRLRCWSPQALATSSRLLHDEERAHRSYGGRLEHLREIARRFCSLTRYIAYVEFDMPSLDIWDLRS